MIVTALPGNAPYRFRVEGHSDDLQRLADALGRARQPSPWLLVFSASHPQLEAFVRGWPPTVFESDALSDYLEHHGVDTRDLDAEAGMTVAARLFLVHRGK